MSETKNTTHEPETVTLTESDINDLISRLTPNSPIYDIVTDHESLEPGETAAHHVFYYLDESAGCGSLEFFDVSHDNEKRTLTFPKSINPDHIDDVIDCYLAIVEEQPIDKFSPEIQRIAHEYDEHTEPLRGADDGTFDYAGTYITALTEILRMYQNRKTLKLVELDLTLDLSKFDGSDTDVQTIVLGTFHPDLPLPNVPEHIPLVANWEIVDAHSVKITLDDFGRPHTHSFQYLNACILKLERIFPVLNVETRTIWS